jgi:single-stranded-DNA-specific exonuclease
LIRFGGHRAAAGVTIATPQVPAFAARFNDIARAALTPDDLVPELHIDLEVPLDQADNELETLLRHLEPCGVGNPSPWLMAHGVTVAAPPRVVGKDGLKLLLSANGRELTALGWGMAARARELEPGATIDIAYRLECDEWNGETRLQARLADFRA